MANTDCPLPLAPDTLNCSGRGIGCINEQCICPKDWLGIGDFVVGSPACQLNVYGVQILWGLVAFFHSLNIFFCLAYLALRPVKSKSRFKELPFLAGCSALFASSSLGSLGYIRSTDPLQTIGTDPSATVLFSLGSAGFWTWTPLVCYTYGELLARGLRGRNEDEKRRISNFLTALKRALPIGWVLAMIASFSPTFILINPKNPDLMYGLAACHFVVLAFALFFYTSTVFWVIPPVERDLNSALREHADSRLISVRKKIIRFKIEVRNQGVFQMISASIFGLWPYAQRFASYELPIAWLGSAFVMAIGLYTMLPTKNKKSTLSSDPSNKKATANTTLPTGEGGGLTSMNSYAASQPR